MPTRYGGLGVRGGGLGLMGLGAAQQAQPFAFPPMPPLALPYIAHLYTNTMQFKRTLGDASSVGGSAGSAMITKPGLKMGLNGGYHPITLEFAGPQGSPNLVVDPGFEASDVKADVQTNWTLAGPAEWDLQSIAGDMRSGRRGVKCTRTNLGPNNWNDISSAAFIPVTPGQTYTASVWSKQLAGTQSSHAQVWWYTASQIFISADTMMANQTGAKPWIYYSAAFVAPANAAFAVMHGSAGWWDGVTGVNAVTLFDDFGLVFGTSTAAAIGLGDVIQLTENGDNSGTVLYTGIVEETPDEVGAGTGGSKHQVNLKPLVAELAATEFNVQYVTLVDVAQMVRDAVGLTAHCRVSPMTVGDTGVLGIYNFNQTNVLEVLTVAKRIAGPNFWWFVDATGLVWFQSTTPTNPARITLERGSDYGHRRAVPSIVGLKNKIRALGGFPAGAAVPIESTYSNAASQKKYNVRTQDPPLIFPTVTDQATLDKIVATVGATFDRVMTTVELDAPKLAQRLTLGVPGGLTTRLREPASEGIAQPSALGTGGYLGPYVAQDIEVNGPQQKLLTSDLPVSGMQDIQYEIDRIIQRAALAPIAQPPVMQPSQGGIIQTGTGSTLVDSTGIVSAGVMTPLINGGVQLGSPINGKGSPPTGLSGLGGEVTVSIASFTLQRAATVMLLAICTNYALVNGGPFGAADLIYFQIDGVTDTTTYGAVPVWASPGNAETRAESTTLLRVLPLATGPHEVRVIWNSQGTNEQIWTTANLIFVFLMGS